MKIILTGSLGHIGKPLATILVQNGHEVIVISSKPERQNEIFALGATPALGSLEDVQFLSSCFSGADAVYTMVPPANYLSPGLDLMAYWTRLGNNYASAIRESGLKRVVHLSSVGAHLEKDSGLIIGHRLVEGILNGLSDVSITHMRPVGFYYNLNGFIPVIKNLGFIAANYGAGDSLVWASPADIAEAVAKELEAAPVNRKLIYVASDELTGNETAAILGEAIGKPDLKWILIPSKQWENGLIAAGVNPEIARGLVEMFASQHSGLLMEDYYNHRPATLGKVKMKDFAKEFAAAFNPS
jgi:uncharacterized protein YbjT (DUF2867 family)